MILIVKPGSSARPSFTNAKLPATTMAMIMNSVTARSRTAQAEMLKPVISRSPALPKPKVQG